MTCSLRMCERLPFIASRSELARPRTVCSSSRVTMKEGHIVPTSSLRQTAMPLHFSTALSQPPSAE